MEHPENFYTLKGYSLLEHAQITASMEDYLEMLYRFYHDGQLDIRIKKLAGHLHVKPSSASKMVNNLKSCDLVRFEKYGLVTLTAKGIELGEYLLMRHEILHQFFCLVNHTSDELEQVEKVEHFITPRTLHNLHALLPNLQK